MYRNLWPVALIFLFSMVLIPGYTAADERKPVEDTLYNYFQRLRSTPGLRAKITLNDSIRDIFRRVLVQKEYFDYPFDTLETVGKVMSPDETFRFINWNIIKPDGTYNYYAFIQYFDDDKDEIVLTELFDQSDSISNPEQQILTPEKWYGALYYEIVPTETRRSRHYLLLGWEGGDLFVNRKVIDVLTFSSRGVPKFGKNVFKFNKERKKRVIFEFSYMATMRLFYDDNIDMVVFEHMVPIETSLQNQKSAYGSDLTFDGLEFDDGKWILKENLDVKNSKKLLNKRKKDISYTF